MAKMTRRGFLGALVALPLVGLVSKADAIFKSKCEPGVLRDKIIITEGDWVIPKDIHLVTNCTIVLDGPARTHAINGLEQAVVNCVIVWDHETFERYKRSGKSYPGSEIMRV